LTFECRPRKIFGEKKIEGKNSPETWKQSKILEDKVTSRGWLKW
jgi:hypothetical protein